MAKRNRKQKQQMKVLVACEYSGRVRDAFIKAGHLAMSCDIIGTETPGPHWEGDLLELLASDWEFDLMIAFPPCTHLASSGARWFAEKRADGRQQEGIDFFIAVAEADIPKICVENPVGIMPKIYKKWNQIVEPWWFGHKYTKQTCLWLKGLPLLTKTNDVKEEMLKLPKKERSMIHQMPPSKDRAKKRALTPQGIADAMAEQWG